MNFSERVKSLYFEIKFGNNCKSARPLTFFFEIIIQICLLTRPLKKEL